MKKILIIFAILALSIFTTLASFYYQRPYRGVTGTECTITETSPRGFCYEDLPSGGFPFAYLYDSGGVSVVGILAPIEDHFILGWFIFDIAFWIAIYSIIFFLIRKK